MVLTTPLIGALAECYPDARITVIATPATAALARHAPGVGDVFEVGRGVFGRIGATVRLGMRAFDLYIDPKDHHSRSSRLLARAARASRTVIHPSNASGAFQPLPPPLAPGHYVDRMLAPMQLLAPEVTFERRPRIGLSSEAAIVASRVRAGLGDRYAVVNVSAGAASRYWRVDRWISLVQWLARHVPVAIVSTPADRAKTHSIASTAANLLAVDTADILELAAVVAGSSLVISPDTSVVHIASAYNRPTVGLYPPLPDNLRLFAPLSDRSAAVVARDGGEIAEIETDDVIAAVTPLL